MKNNKLILFLLIFSASIFLQGCSFGFNKNTKNQKQTTQNNTVTTPAPIDYVKEIAKDQNQKSECDVYKSRVNTEIETYKNRISRVSENPETFKLIGIFKSKTLNTCFYVLEDSYINNGNNTTDYIINNAQIEQTIDVFNNVDYKFLNQRIADLEK